MQLQSCPHCHFAQQVKPAQNEEHARCVRCGSLMKAPEAAPGGFSSIRERAQHAPGKRFAQQPAVNHYKEAQRRPNFSIEGYEIKECRGRGGMGQVYRAIQKSLGREVAIKTLDSSLARNEASIMRFTKEAAAMAKLRHPNIVNVIDRGSVRQRHYFIMEFVDGPSLRDLLQDGAFNPQEAMRIMQQLARTMEYAHTQGVIHRDLKPENILYTSSGVLKVADFGLAGVNKETTHIRKLTKSFVSMGTECYMAPEQRRDAKNVDMRADIYSMGVIFFELLTNQIPLTHLPNPDTPIVPEYPQIDAIIHRCLQQPPEKRFENTAALCAAIDKAITQGPQPCAHDTVIDTPAVIDHVSFSSRLSVWPDRLHSSLVQFASSFSSTWDNGRFRQLLWSSGALGALALAVGLFFVFSPKPPTPKSMTTPQATLTAWQKQSAQEKQLPHARTALSFDFHKRRLRTVWGRHPRPQWNLRGEWRAAPGQLSQNTYRRFFVRNQKLRWAQYTGHLLSPQALSHAAQASFLSPRVPHNGQVLPLRRYLKKFLPNQRNVSLYPTVGIGLRSSDGGQIALLVQRQNNRLRYTLRVRGRTINKRKAPMRIFPGPLRESFRYGNTLSLKLTLQGHKVSAWVNGKAVETIALQPQEWFHANPGFICRDAHCKFTSFDLQGHISRRHES